MATREYWIQIECRHWDLTPNDGGINRMTGVRVEAKPRELVWLGLDSDGQPVERARKSADMYRPIEALIFRRYAPPQRDDGADAWTVPDDRRVNPWDINEKDPSETMGTIPGPTIECHVGDRVVVHFRNMDFRQKGGALLHPFRRTHSLHPHGITFSPVYDGAYPLSPLDTFQRIDAPERDETALWAVLDLDVFVSLDRQLRKRGDRIPPGGTFTYFWDTNNWTSTAGVWLYHDHSVEDHYNVLYGAIGMLVVHDPNDPDDVFIDIDDNGHHAMRQLPGEKLNGAIVSDGQYVRPPEKMLILQLYHELLGGGMCINGRKFLGNTPTVVGGPRTLMKFGLAAMNNTGFHTFHLHGHRWTLTGSSKCGYRPVTQVVDTNIFGPADSFHFSIRQGSDSAPPSKSAKGEWHMHCHVLDHMMNGMMGSLLIVSEGDAAEALPVGAFVPSDSSPEGEVVTSISDVEVQGIEGYLVTNVGTEETRLEISSGQLDATLVSRPVTIIVEDMKFLPRSVIVSAGAEVIFDFRSKGHTVTSSTEDGDGPIEINSGNGPKDSITDLRPYRAIVRRKPGTVVQYRCGNHPVQMTGEISLV